MLSSVHVSCSIRGVKISTANPSRNVTHDQLISIVGVCHIQRILTLTWRWGLVAAVRRSVVGSLESFVLSAQAARKVIGPSGTSEGEPANVEDCIAPSADSSRRSRITGIPSLFTSAVSSPGRRLSRRCCDELINANTESQRLQYQKSLHSQYACDVADQESAPIVAAAESVLWTLISHY